MPETEETMRGKTYLKGNWVYYKSLKTTTYYPMLGDIVTERVETRATNFSNIERICKIFQRMANSELKHEKDLLKSKFGYDLKGNYRDVGFAKNLIDALNECLGVKEVYERNLALIQYTKGQKNVMSFFPTYFEQAWFEYIPKIWDQFNIKDNNIAIDQQLLNTINEAIPEITRLAIIKMFQAGQENGLNKLNQDYSKAYQDIEEAFMNNAAGTQEFINSFIQNYNLDKIGELLKDSIVNQKDVMNIVTKKGKFNVHANLHSKAGLTMEDFRSYIFNLIGDGIHGNKDINIQGITTGRTKIKADSVATIDIPIDEISNWIEENSFGTRDKNTKAIFELSKKLKKFNKGFIVYTNAKNYSLNSGFEKGTKFKAAGFSAGEPISLRNFEQIAKNLDLNYGVLVRTCLQLIPGAIGENYIEQVKLGLIPKVVSALFDDFDVIENPPEDGATAIHILDLNGVLIPISFYFRLLEMSFGECLRQKPEKLVSVNIDMPQELMYGQYEKAPPGKSLEHWTNQREYVLDNIKISYYFLSAFQKIMNDINKI